MTETSKIRVYTPAGVDRMLAFANKAYGRLQIPGERMASLLMQVTAPGSRAFCWQGDVIPFALAGVWHEQEAGQLWLMVRPAPVKALAGLLRHPLLAAEYRQAPGGKMRTFIIPGHRPGERMARLAGFTPLNELKNGFRVWEYGENGSSNSSPDWRGGFPV